VNHGILSSFSEIWVLDFEFHAPAGHHPEPLCLVTTEVNSGRTVRLWADDMARRCNAPLSTDSSAVAVTYFGSAEWGCFLELGWPLPTNVIDLYAEFRLATNGLKTPCGKGLLGALVYHGLPSIGSVEKGSMRDLAIRGGPFSADERLALISYCESDVRATAELLLAMAPVLDLPRALIRGRYTKAVARMERVGIPIVAETLVAIRANWEAIKLELVDRVDARFGVYDGTRFKAVKWLAWCDQNGVPWPRLDSGGPQLDRATFRAVASSHPMVRHMKELRSALGELRLESLHVGPDGRNRCMLSPYGSRTGRNQPSNSKFLFGPSAWIRSLIKPPPGWAVAYIDWSQQEYGIAASLSGDSNMLAAYLSGDPYLAFARMAGAVPAGATKASHKAERDRFKTCSLGVLFGMGAQLMANRIQASEADARYLIEEHKRVFHRFWRWRDAAVTHADLQRQITATFGWRLNIAADFDKPGEYLRPTSVSNFPMQANGAEMLRLACIRATEEGILVCAPVHDALLVEAPVDAIEATIERTKEIMRWASAQILDGFELDAEAEKVVCYPGRFEDGRGAGMWRIVTEFLKRKG
jgi:DNA polymerase I